MNAATVKQVRCAIYTRVSTDSGLDQEFNSLDIQYDAAQAYIRSQAHAHWMLIGCTTRSVAPTEAGEHLLRNVGPHFAQIEAELGVLADLGAKPSGTIRLSSTENGAASVLWPAFRGLLADYPGIHIEVSIDNGPTDIVAEGFDAGVRHGEMVAKGMIAVPVGPAMRTAVVGTPEYFKRRGRPRTPKDLTDHECITLRFTPDGGLYSWEFEKKGHELGVRVEGHIVVTTAPASLTAALAGLGLAYVPEDMVKDHLASGLLERVLLDWCEPFTGYHLYYPNRRQHSAAFAVLIERLRYRE